MSLLPLITLTGCLTNEDKVARSVAVQKSSAQIDEAISQQDQVRENLRIQKLPSRCGTKVDPAYEPTDSYRVLASKADIALFEANNTLVQCYNISNKRIDAANGARK